MPQCKTCPVIVPEGVTRCHRCTLQAKRPDSVLKRDSDAYHISLRDEERAYYEKWAHNFYTSFGQNLKIPPRLYSDMKAAGVDMRHMEADPNLETAGGEWDK
jgi:hypothetical protein